jgi:cytochrome c5
VRSIGRPARRASAEARISAPAAAQRARRGGEGAVDDELHACHAAPVELAREVGRDANDDPRAAGGQQRLDLRR